VEKENQREKQLNQIHKEKWCLKLRACHLLLQQDKTRLSFGSFSFVRENSIHKIGRVWRP